MAHRGLVLVTGATGRVGRAALATFAKSGQCTARAAATGSITRGVDQFKNHAGVKRDGGIGGFSSVSAATQQPSTVPGQWGTPGFPGTSPEQFPGGSPQFNLKQPAMGFSPNAPAALKLHPQAPTLRDHVLYNTLVERGAYFKPEMPDVDMQYPAYFDPTGKNPKWDPKQVSGHEWHELVMAEMANSAANACIVHDVYSKIFITGPKAREFLGRIMTCVVAKTVGDVRMGYVCRNDGQLMNEATIATRGENDFYYCGQLGWGAYEMNLLLPLREELGYTAEEVSIDNNSHHYELLHVAGPKSKQVLAEVMGQEVADIPVFKFRNLTIDGVPIEAFRMSFTGMPGFEFHVPAEHARSVYDKICDHPVSVKAGLKPHGLLAVAGLRIEQFYRVSADVKDVAHYTEMSVDRFISPKKRAAAAFHGCDDSFVPQKEFCYLDVDTPKGWEWTLTFSPKSPIFLDGEEVGHTTSAAVGGQSKRTHACALLYRRGLGNGLTIKAHGQEFAARVLKEPLVRYSGRD